MSGRRAPIAQDGEAGRLVQSPVDAPTTVAELRVALIAGERLHRSLDTECVISQLPHDWSSDWLRQARLHMLLIETEGLDGRNGRRWTSSELRELVGACRSLGIPSAGWAVDGPASQHYPASLLAEVDRVFGPDPGTAEALDTRTADRPVILPHAASADALCRANGVDRGIAYVGPATAGTAAQGAFAEELLDAGAGLDLRILCRAEEELAQIPDRLRPRARLAVDAARLMEALLGCRLLVNYDPADGTPRLFFDALAAGVLVIAPRNQIAMRVLPGLVAYPRSIEETTERIAWCMEDGPEQADLLAAGRNGIRHGHTYQHRIATIASSLGYPVLPNSP